MKNSSASGPQLAQVGQGVDRVRRAAPVDVHPADREPRVGRRGDDRHEVAVLGRADRRGRSSATADPVGTKTTSSRPNSPATSLAATRWPWWMGSNVPPMIPTRPPATDRAYPGPPEPARADRLRLTSSGTPARRPGCDGPPRPAPPCSRSQTCPCRRADAVDAGATARHRAAPTRDERRVTARPGTVALRRSVHRPVTGGRASSTSDRVDRSTRRQADASTRRTPVGAQRVVTNSASWAALRHSTMSMTSPYRSAAESPLPHSRRGSGFSQCADRERRHQVGEHRQRPAAGSWSGRRRARAATSSGRPPTRYRSANTSNAVP